MVDSNLLLISALAVGGYYMWSTYSVEEAAEDLTNAVIDGALAVGGVVLERTGEMLEEVGDAVVEVATNEDGVVYKATQNLQDVVSGKTRDELEDNEPGISWTGNSTGTQVMKDMGIDPCYRSKTDNPSVDGFYAVVDYFEDYENVPGCDIKCYRETGNGTKTGDGSCYVYEKQYHLPDFKQISYDIQHPEEAAQRKAEEARITQEKWDAIESSESYQDMMRVLPWH